jgi:cytochrome c oxidase cbb3-type subunit 3
MFSRPKDLPITAPALNNQGFLNSASDQMIKHTIMNGRKETPMPAGPALGLSEKQVDDIISYLRSFEQAQILHKTAVIDEESPSLVYESPYDFEETVENVKRSIAGMNFVHIRDQALDGGLVPEGKESKKQMMVYFCNFNFLYQALSLDPRVGLFLPCRITIVEHEGQVQVMSINPKHLSHLFNNNELDDACDEMHEVYTSILEDATL